MRTTIKKLNGDCLTPIVIFQRLQGRQKFLLESAAKHETAGRYSFIGANPRKTYASKEGRLQEINHLTDKTSIHDGELFAALQQMMPRISHHTEYPFTGGAIGYIERGEVVFQVYDTVIIFDHLLDELIVVHTNIDIEHKTPHIDTLIEQITTGTMTDNQQHPFAQYRQFRLTEKSAYLYYVEFADDVVFGCADHSIVKTASGDAFKNSADHPIALLARAAKSTPSLIGYIGLNGQMDFTEKCEVNVNDVTTIQ